MSYAVHSARGGARPVTRVLLVLLVLSPLCLAALRLGESDADRALSAAGEPPPTDVPRITTRHPVGAPKPLLGFAVNCHHISDLPLYLDAVDEIADLGANALIVVTPMFQKHVNSVRIRSIRSKCPTDQQLAAIIKRARQHGLYTVLMPIVLIEDPEEADWRGVIRPRNWDAWWTSYASGLDRFVTLAEDLDVDLLSVGSELNTTEHQIDRWQRLIASVRGRFSGLITYSSNWDRYERVDLWPLVDVMSVSAYFELERDRPGAPVDALVRAWVPVRESLLAAAREQEKPLLLSEVGYPSLPWANAHPWNYVADDGEEADHAAQARSWRAFFGAWTDVIADPESDVIGVCGYRWDPYRRGDEHDTGYGIAGKPSRDVIRGGFAEIRRASARPVREPLTHE